MRTGIGYDIHPLERGRALVLGGVRIEHESGLAGYSDGDALTHAVIDALLGAAALGDIGAHFPPGDPQYAGANSLDLLRRTVALLDRAGHRVVNIDATVIAEALGVDTGAVSVKAKTADALGAIGRGEGIAALAIALVD